MEMVSPIVSQFRYIVCLLSIIDISDFTFKLVPLDFIFAFVLYFSIDNFSPMILMKSH